MATNQLSAVGPQSLTVVPESFQKIENIVVLMLENRSFDHLLGYLNDPGVDGLTGNESNYEDPNSQAPPPVVVRRARSPVMPFDPSHEFADVQMQLYGPRGDEPSIVNSPADSAPMNGFVYSAMDTANKEAQHNTRCTREDGKRIMDCFQPDQVPVLSALAREFAMFNTWYSSLPGPTWPNRFFVHAATSGGLSDSPPDIGRMIEGYSFRNGTIYDRLEAYGKHWRIYHDDPLPQTVGLNGLHEKFLGFQRLQLWFRWMNAFEHDIGMKTFDGGIQPIGLPEYTFIEPYYDNFSNCRYGNSMHPLNDIREGEKFVKRVYEGLRNSPFWPKTMLIITFDEHGGFYDHVPPPATVATGDDKRYASGSFSFDRLGVRVPGIVVSAYTQKGTVIGSVARSDPGAIFDHSSVLATVEKRFNLPPLTNRDTNANTLDIALNLPEARDDAPTKLPDPAPDSLFDQYGRESTVTADNAPLSANQRSFLALAAACDMKLSVHSEHQAILDKHAQISTQGEAAEYFQKVENQIRAVRPQAH